MKKELFMRAISLMLAAILCMGLVVSRVMRKIDFGHW